MWAQPLPCIIPMGPYLMNGRAQECLPESWRREKATGNAQSQHLRTLLPAEIISSRRGTRISFIKQNLDLTSGNGVC